MANWLLARSWLVLATLECFNLAGILSSYVCLEELVQIIPLWPTVHVRLELGPHQVSNVPSEAVHGLELLIVSFDICKCIDYDCQEEVQQCEEHDHHESKSIQPIHNHVHAVQFICTVRVDELTIDHLPLGSNGPPEGAKLGEVLPQHPMRHESQHEEQYGEQSKEMQNVHHRLANGFCEDGHFGMGTEVKDQLQELDVEDNVCCTTVVHEPLCLIVQVRLRVKVVI
mmetsp:Transcript_68432/g.127710  ORF Transcript_68432/g.127710 Transcript_68432/m.127710 type:complete len:227 (-) Transcript_68432:832-1512(-)